MNRRVKQFLYGTFYLFVFGLFFWWIYIGFLSTGPTCSDGIQNQGEEGVDCGGPCDIECERLNLKPISKTGPVDVFNYSKDVSTALAELNNPNKNYVGEFDYSMRFFSKEGSILEEFTGSAYVLPSENFYIHEITKGLDEKVDRADLSWGEVEWKRLAHKKEAPEVSRFSTSVEDDSIIIKGKVKNNSSDFWGEVEVIAVLKNDFNFNVGTSQTLLEDVEGLEERSFEISIPFNNELKEKVNLENTQVLTAPLP